MWCQGRPRRHSWLCLHTQCRQNNSPPRLERHRMASAWPHLRTYRQRTGSSPEIIQKVRLLLNGTSAIFWLLVSRIIEIKRDTCYKLFEIDEFLINDLRMTSSTYRNNVNVHSESLKMDWRRSHGWLVNVCMTWDVTVTDCRIYLPRHQPLEPPLRVQ